MSKVIARFFLLAIALLSLGIPIGAETGKLVNKNGKLSVETDLFQITQPDYYLSVKQLPKNSPQWQIHKQIKCLADNIYYEAGGEPELGKIAVARVTMNRVHSGKFADSVCGVVYQGSEPKPTRTNVSCQFSWTCYRDQIKKPVDAVWRRCYEIAAQVMLQDAHAEVLPGVYFFHADYAQVHYKLAYVEQIGHHLFYRRPGDN